MKREGEKEEKGKRKKCMSAFWVNATLFIPFICDVFLFSKLEIYSGVMVGLGVGGKRERGREGEGRQKVGAFSLPLFSF